jgi:hypothetical protein
MSSSESVIAESRAPESGARLLEWARSYRSEYRRLLREQMASEREERHARGETYYEGIWIPGSRLGEVERALADRSRVLRNEIHALVVVLLVVAAVVWYAFGRFLMPYY